MSDIEELERKIDAAVDLDTLTAVDYFRATMRRAARSGNISSTMWALQKIAAYRRAKEIREDLQGVLPDAEIDRLLDAVRPVPAP